MDELIFFMSAIVHPMAFLCSFSTLKSFSSYKLMNAEETIIERVDQIPRNPYFKYESHGLRSNVGSSSMDCFVSEKVAQKSKDSNGVLKTQDGAANKFTHSTKSTFSLSKLATNDASKGSWG